MSFGGWSPPPRRITAADILAGRGCRLVEPLLAAPLDNWPPSPRCRLPGLDPQKGHLDEAAE
jgi:hypothetical protein